MQVRRTIRVTPESRPRAPQLRPCLNRETLPIRNRLPQGLAAVVILIALAPAGCQLYVNDADRQVYKLIEKREQQAIGTRPASDIDKEIVPQAVPRSAYDHVPSPTKPDIPDAMRATSHPSTQPLTPPTSQQFLSSDKADDVGPTTQPDREGETTTQTQKQAAPTTRPVRPMRMKLSDALSFAFGNSREFQSAKEDLYLSALALTLERHMWGPRFTAGLSTDYANYGQIRNFDHAMRAISNVAVQQRLPYGGEVTAKVIDTYMRDLGRRITSNESGQAIMEANVPILRGAGKVARESLYQAERNLIYSTRSFERYRQSFAVRIAVAYFELVRQKQQIANARSSYRSFYADSERSTALFQAGRLIELEAQRAQQQLLSVWNRVVDTEEAYQRALDAFKILLGMTTTEPIDIVEEDYDLMIPKIEEPNAIDIALSRRLDLINDRDAIDDAHRGVNVTQNGLLPDLNFRGNVTWDTNPNELDVWHYEHERATWRAGMDLNLPLDRVKERNDYRAALIDLRRAERRYEQSADTVRLQVRQAKGEIERAMTSLSIQRQSIDLAQRQREAADFRFKQGLISNREVVDAENNLLSARDGYASAQSRLYQALLAFYLNTGMIRASDEGQLLDPVALKH